MADLPIRKRTLAETLQSIADRIREYPPGALDPYPIALSLDVAAQEAADSDAEAWKHQAALERERADGAHEVAMRWALALEPPIPGRWHFGAGVPHLASRCTDYRCWSPIPMPAGRTGMLRLGWDVDLAMVSPRQVIRFDPEPGAAQPGQDGG